MFPIRAFPAACDLGGGGWRAAERDGATRRRARLGDLGGAVRSDPSRAFGGRTQKPCHFPALTVAPPLTNGVSTVDFGIRDKFETCSDALRSRSRTVDAGPATLLFGAFGAHLLAAYVTAARSTRRWFVAYHRRAEPSYDCWQDERGLSIDGQRP